MNITIISPLQYGTTSQFEMLDIAISFKPYLNHIKELLKNEKTIKAGFYQFIIKTFRKYPELEQPIDLKDIEKYREILELLYATLSDDILSIENEKLWALSKPVQPLLFYSTDALYHIVSAENERAKSMSFVENRMTQAQELALIYSFILYKLYDCHAPENEIHHMFLDPETGLEKYFSVDIDFRFVDLKTEGGIPDLDFDTLQCFTQKEQDLTELQRILPLNNFKFEGFSVITLRDITTEFVVNHIKNLILNRDIFNLHTLYDDIVHGLKNLIQCHDIEIGLLPFLNINKKFVFNKDIAGHSILIKAMTGSNIPEAEYQESAHSFYKNPRQIFFDDITFLDENERPFVRTLKKSDFVSLVVLPVYFNKKLTGVLELCSKRKGAIDKKHIALIEMVLPQIGQMFQNNISEFELRIENIIKQNFTSLQPSVQWKFNEVAWLYIKENSGENTNAELQKILFKSVYPLYGAIDIRNSTVERNIALQKDILAQLALLEKTLVGISKKIMLDLIKELLFECKKWALSIAEFINSAEEYRLNNFLSHEVAPLFLHLKENYLETEKLIDNYFENIHETTGMAFENRRKLETSITLINTVINNHLELMARELQQAYPFYFEKFRTDGVEYDIYIGQSIAPERPFDALYLRNARLWQLKSMASIVRVSQVMTPQLPTVLETTHLIFAHSNAIDISFRNDERRFDVEGAYNIRYQVIKKRIDKVHVNGSDERLTQPGKIAIVYFNQKEADEYIKFIKSLIAQKILLNDLEYLELEDLQGVAGLKALRVGVNVS
jgi:hypothetical protein